MEASSSFSTVLMVHQLGQETSPNRRTSRHQDSSGQLFKPALSDIQDLAGFHIHYPLLLTFVVAMCRLANYRRVDSWISL
jgi:hypothetical protein